MKSDTQVIMSHAGPITERSDWETFVPRINVENVIELDFYWNKCTLYIKIEILLQHYYIYNTLFIEITQSVQFVVTSVS
jgi:hypothetical protein